MNRNAAKRCDSRIFEPERGYTETASGYSLSQDFPDSLNPTTRIEYTLPRGGYVMLTVGDNIPGERIDTVLSGEQGSGKHIFTLDTSGYESGFNFCRSYAEGILITRRLYVSR